MTRPEMDPDEAGYLPNGRPTVERLLADTEQQLDLAEKLPERLAAIHGWASNSKNTITVTVNSNGELVDIQIAEIALTADPRAIGEQIVALSDRAYRAAIAKAIEELAPVIGDADVLELARATGLDDHIDPDAPVVDADGDIYTPPPVGETTPASSDGTQARREPEEDEDITTLDFSRFRSDR